MKYCSQCGLPLQLMAVSRHPFMSSIYSDHVPACANCGARNYEEPVKSAGINMILAGRVADLERANKDLKICCADYLELMKKANAISDHSGMIANTCITQRNTLVSILAELLDDEDIAFFDTAIEGGNGSPLNLVTWKEKAIEALKQIRPKP